MKIAPFALLISLGVMTGCPPPNPVSDWTPSDAAEPVDAAEQTPDAHETPDAAPPEPDARPMAMFDCATIPSTATSFTMISGPRGYHGLAIDLDGYMIGSDGSSLIKSAWNATPSVFVPSAGSGQQMDWLADGNLVFATNDSALTRIDMNGGRSPISTDVSAYGVIVGPDANIYAINTSQRALVRVHPVTGAKETLVTGFPSTPRAMEFNPEATRIYIGTIGNGTVYYVDLDENMNVVGNLEVFATGVGSGWHDAVGVDACGNLYVPDYSSRSLVRVSPTGVPTTIFQAASLSEYPHGLVWGTGKYNWRADALYVPLPYNNDTVAEIVIGAPSRDFQGIVLNKPPATP